MIKTLQFGEKQVSFSTNFAWCIEYKSQFHRDPAQVLIPATKVINGVYAKQTEGGQKTEDDFGYQLYEALGVVEIANIDWSMARLVDKSIPGPEEWVESFGDDFGTEELLVELMPEAINSCFTTKKSKAPIPAETKKKAPVKK